VRSDVFSSLHQVRGLQFAATQSDAVQILPDPDFADPLLSTWASTGDAAPLELTQGASSQLGSLVRVTRMPSAYTWQGLSIAYPAWGAFAAGARWEDIEGSGFSDFSSYGGIVYAGPPVPVTPGGRLYAAARVFSSAPLSAPLALQILDGATGQVLAEEDSPAAGGMVTEWYVGYALGAPGSPSSYTWAQVQAAYPAWSALSGIPWNAADTFTPPPGSTMSVRLIQQQVTDDSWDVDNISLFDDAITWEFSSDGGASWHFAYDIRNNPRGVMLFPPPAEGDGSQLMWRLSGYRAGLHVSALAIRPWYGVHPLGMPPRAGGIGCGPNVAPLDHYDLVERDPRWKAWDLPVPRDWWFLQRQLLIAAGGLSLPAPAFLPSPVPAPDVVLGTALVLPPSESAPAPSFSQAVVLFGQSGAFGGVLPGATVTPSGHSFTAYGVPGWEFGPGLCVFYSRAMSDGQIVMSTVPLTQNQFEPTMDHAEVNIFDPARVIFYSQRIPTSQGVFTAVEPGRAVGGTDAGAGDMLAVLSDGTEKLLFTCSGYYFGWSIPETGLYPVLGFLERNPAGLWGYDPASSLTGDQWEATNPAAYAALAPSGETAGNGASYWGTRAAAQMAQLPASGRIVTGHYFGTGAFTSGCISVSDTVGNLLAAYQIPNITPSSGTLTMASVRDVEADPASVINDERFVIIYDAIGTGVHATFQEFSWNEAARAITPVSVPCTVADTGLVPQFAVFGPDGTLYITTFPAGSPLTAGNTSVYLRHPAGRNAPVSAPAVPGWPSGSWGTPVKADYSLGFTASQGLGFPGPCQVDPVTKSLLVAAGSGQFGAAVPDASTASPGPNLLSAFDSGFEPASMLSADDSVFAGSLGSWTAFLGAVTRVPSPPHPPPAGTAAMQIAPFAGSEVFQSGQTAYPFPAGSICQARVSFLSASAARACEIYLQWWKADGTTFISDSAHASAADSPGSWTTITVSGTAPAGAAYVQVIGQVDSPAEIHYIASCFLWNLSAVNWTSFLTGIYLSSAQALDGGFSLVIQSLFPSETLAAVSPAQAVVPYREYLAKASFRAAATGQPCSVGIRWYDSLGHILGSDAHGTLNVTDTTSGWSEAWCGALAPAGAAAASVVLIPQTTLAAEIHYADRVSLQAQPYSAIPSVNYEMNALRAAYPSQFLGNGRPSLVGRKLYVPVSVGFGAAELAAYSAATYVPAAKPQFLARIDLAQVLDDIIAAPLPPQTAAGSAALSAAGALAAAGTVTAAPAPQEPVFGLDAQTGTWSSVESALGVASIAGWRAYNGTGLPASYPGADAPVPAGVTVPVVSFKPSLPISTADQAALATLFSHAPPGSMTTIWHEGEKAGFTPAQIKAAHALAYSIFRAHAPATALYGQILMTYTGYSFSSHYPLSQWVAAQSGGAPLDFYGLDWYPNSNSINAVNSITPAVTQLKSVVPAAVIAITECNYTTGSGITWTGAQDQWLRDAWAWAKSNGAITFIPYFDTAHGVPWPPPAAVITELKAIIAESSPHL
jgi:hypothetical protein